MGNDRFVYRLEDPHTSSGGNVDPQGAQVGGSTPPQPMARAVLTRVETGSRGGSAKLRSGLGWGATTPS